MTLRLRADEDDAIAEAAEAAGLSISEWIRDVGQRAARSPEDGGTELIRGHRRSLQIDPDLRETFEAAAERSRFAGGPGTPADWLRMVAMAAVGRGDLAGQLRRASGIAKKP